MIENTTNAILEDPTLLINPEYNWLRKIVHKVSSQPIISPPSIKPLATTASTLISDMMLSNAFLPVFTITCINQDMNFCTTLFCK